MKWISKYQKTGKLNFKTTGLPWQQSKQDQEITRNTQSRGILNPTNLKNRLQPAAKKLAKKGVRPSQGSYFTSKLNQELNRSYLEQVAKRNIAIANDVTKLSPKIQLPIQIIPNIIDIHARNK